jgi:hypothetical protein
LAATPQLVHDAVSRSQGSDASGPGAGRDQDREELEEEQEREQDEEDACLKEKQASKLGRSDRLSCADLTRIEAYIRLGKWDGARQILWDVLEGDMRSKALQA